jgi:hypothetical protein
MRFPYAWRFMSVTYRAFTPRIFKSWLTNFDSTCLIFYWDEPRWKNNYLLETSLPGDSFDAAALRSLTLIQLPQASSCCKRHHQLHLALQINPLWGQTNDNNYGNFPRFRDRSKAQGLPRSYCFTLSIWSHLLENAIGRYFLCDAPPGTITPLMLTL